MPPPPMLEAAEVLIHPFVVGELACGEIQHRHELLLSLMDNLPQMTVASHEEVLAFGKMVGADLSTPSVKSPAQAEKSGVDKDLINSFVTRNPGALKLVPQDKNHSEKVFSK